MKATAKKPHWYMQHIGECPVCGKDKSYRVRMHTKRPKGRKKRIVWLSGGECYDGCMG
jgi:hypothetical protein